MRIPWGFLSIVGGLGLVFLTEHDTYGWILVGLGIFFTLFSLVIFLGIMGVAAWAATDTTSYKTNFGRTLKKRDKSGL